MTNRDLLTIMLRQHLRGLRDHELVELWNEYADEVGYNRLEEPEEGLQQFYEAFCKQLGYSLYDMILRFEPDDEDGASVIQALRADWIYISDTNDVYFLRDVLGCNSPIDIEELAEWLADYKIPDQNKKLVQDLRESIGLDTDGEDDNRDVRITSALEAVRAYQLTDADGVDISLLLEALKEFHPASQEQARDVAIDFQAVQNGLRMSWGEAAETYAEFQRIGKECGLLEEFQENGIC